MRKEGHTIKTEKVKSVQLTGHQNPKYCQKMDFGRLLKSEKSLKVAINHQKHIFRN